MILKGVEETENDPVKEQDSKNEDDEFHRIKREQEQKQKIQGPSPAIWP
jgi:hypothetical protein